MAKNTKDLGLFSDLNPIRRETKEAPTPDFREKAKPVTNPTAKKPKETVDDDQAKKEETIQEPNVTKGATAVYEQENKIMVSTGKFQFERNSKETLTVRKSFLITESQNEQFSSLAKKLNISENRLFIQILEQVFSA